MNLTYYDHRAGQHVLMKRYKWCIWGFVAGTLFGVLVGVCLNASFTAAP